MKRNALIVAGLVTVFLMVGAAQASAQTTEQWHPPHQEEQDGCDHGATGKDCRPDPQPEHGQECETHGGHGGVNEDHCAPTPAPTVVSDPAPTAPPAAVTAPPVSTKKRPPLARTGIGLWLVALAGLSSVALGFVLRGYKNN